MAMVKFYGQTRTSFVTSLHTARLVAKLACLTITLSIKSESTGFYIEIAAANAKSQSRIAFESAIDPSSNFASLTLTETCQVSKVVKHYKM